MQILEQQLEAEIIIPSRPSPAKFFETMQAYQRTAALKAAVELDLFTAIGETDGTVSEVARRINGSERGVRALCDYMVIIGFASKYLDEAEPRYGLTPDSATFLHRKSPAYVGGATKFLGSQFVMNAFSDLATVVRTGGPLPNQHSAEVESAVWVDFATGMAPIMFPLAEQVATILDTHKSVKVLDVAAGHGLFGIAIARRNPLAKIVALDWSSVLAVAEENARRFGVSERYDLLAGDAIEVPFGSQFDVVLLTNVLHHWDRERIEKLLRKVHAALAPGGCVVVVEFAPNDDRVSPQIPAAFVLNMLAMTAAGDAYTLSEHLEMLRISGFSKCETHSLQPSPEVAILALRE